MKDIDSPYIFLVCPECSKRGVTLRDRGESHYGCRYCGWNAFTTGQGIDRDRREKLQEANPEWDVRVKDYWEEDN